MIDIGTKVKFVGTPIKGRVVGHTFYKRPSYATVEPGYIVLLDRQFQGYIDSNAKIAHYVDTCVAHASSVEETEDYGDD